MFSDEFFAERFGERRRFVPIRNALDEDGVLHLLDAEGFFSECGERLGDTREIHIHSGI